MPCDVEADEELKEVGQGDGLHVARKRSGRPTVWEIWLLIWHVKLMSKMSMGMINERWRDFEQDLAQKWMELPQEAVNSVSGERMRSNLRFGFYLFTFPFMRSKWVKK